MSAETPGPGQPEASFTRLEFKDDSIQDEIDGRAPASEIIKRKQEPLVDPGELLGYEPFDAEAELAELRRLREAKDPDFPDQLQRLRDKVAEQRTGLGDTLQQIYIKLMADPDGELTSLVNDAAVAHRLSAKQYNLILNGLELHRKQREDNKALFEAHQGNPNTLFEALFNERPQGAVEVELAPASLHTRCFKLQDYVTAYTANLHGRGPWPTQEHIDRAKQSAGAAFRRQPHPNTPTATPQSVTLENATHNAERKGHWESSTSESTLQNGTLDRYFGHHKPESLVIESGPHTWFITDEGENGEVRIQYLSGGEQRDITLTRAIDENGRFKGYQRSDEPEEAPELSYQEHFDLQDSGEPLSSLEIDGSGIHYTDRRPEGAHLTIISYEYQEGWKLKDPDYTTDIKTHETQHRLNSLFSPLQDLTSTTDIAIAVLKQYPEGQPNEDARAKILQAWTLNKRRAEADPRTRDEILAFLQEDLATEEIYKTLSESPLYDYAHLPDSEKAWTDWRDLIRRHWQNEFKLVSYPVDDTKSHELASLTDDEIKEAVEDVYGAEYKQELRGWIDVVEVLQSKGYGRDEIIGLLYQEPVNHWAAFGSLIVPDMRKQLAERANARKPKKANSRPPDA